MLELFLGLLIVATLLWAIATLYLSGPDLSAFDQAPGPSHNHGQAPSAENAAVVASLGGVSVMLKGVPLRQHLPLLRKYMDEVFEFTDTATRFSPVNANGVTAEWVLAPNADSQRRLLYIHGGAFIMGSPKSHRRLTAKFSELANAAVLAIDYRLMPEHPLMAGIEDCRTAYRWLLDHGPQGAAPASAIFVAGDSAGGNLALSLIAWLRDQRMRAPNAAVALSPLTDVTLGSPSLRGNLASDPMLGPLFKWMTAIPRTLLLWGVWLQTRLRPCDPAVSPIHGDLAGLPPLLVHASSAEMLLDDSRRYVNKAIAAGSPVTLQTWEQMVHVWQIFYPELPEGREALEEVGRFLRSHS